MSEAASPLVSGSRKTTIRVAIVLAVAAAIVYLLAVNLDKMGTILMVAFGFGGVVMVHEFGHFIVGKLAGMKVTAFSIGFPPVLLGIKRTEAGMRLRVLPTLVPKEGGQEGEGALECTFGKGGSEWDTEYCIGLIPIGGYVAVLGQEDFGAAERDPDPRSFMNKPLLPRIIMIMAGVTFNVISALIIFMVIFHNGIKLQAPVLGSVTVNSPAEKAGLKVGDEIASINGDSFIDFANIMYASVLGNKGEAVNMVVKRQGADDKVTEFPVSIVPESGKGTGIFKSVRVLGVGPAHSLRIRKLANDDQRKLLADTAGLAEGDAVVAVDGRPVKDGIEFDNVIEHMLKPDVLLTVECADAKTGQVTRRDVPLKMDLVMLTPDFEKDFTLNSVFGMVPRLQVAALPGDPDGATTKKKGTLASLTSGGKKASQLLKKGDVLLKVGDCEYPTFLDLRKVMTAHTNASFAHDKDSAVPFSPSMQVVVERVVDGQPHEVTLEVVPSVPSEPNTPSLLGIVAGLDESSPAISRIIEAANGLKVGSIPAGATIVSVGGEKVASFFDIVVALRRNADRKTDIEWQKGQDKGTVSLSVPLNTEGMTMTSDLVVAVPFGDLLRSYKAASPLQATVMGWKRTELFIMQAVVTFEKLISGALSPTTLSGPLGIVKATYDIAAQKGVDYYFYWLALISAMIAVMNLLPLPILDGGVVILMLIEKIKGSPISRRAMEVLNYGGWIAIMALMLYVTMNDIKNFF